MFDVFYFNGYGTSICKINGKNIAKILKNGSKSLEKLCMTKGYKITSVVFDPDLNIDTEDYIIDVYFRNPIERYFSALETVNYEYKIPEGVSMLHEVPRTASQGGFFLDNHFHPQYWFLISAYIETWSSDRLYFRFYNFDDIDKNVLGGIKENVSSNKIQRTVIDKKNIEQRYVYDFAIYNNLIGKTINFPQLLELFSEVTDGYPRVSHYITKMSLMTKTVYQ